MLQTHFQFFHCDMKIGEDSILRVLRLGLASVIVVGASLAFGQTPLDEESPWPRVRSTNGNTVTLFQPQVESWSSNSFVARAAVGLKLAGAKSESLGVMWFSATGSVDRVSRIVTLDHFQLSKARFSDSTEKNTNAITALREVLPSGAHSVSLDYLVSALGFSQAATSHGAQALRHVPPEIIWVTNRTVLVLIDGEPVLRPVPGGTMQRVLNTPALLVRVEGAFYLAGDGRWFSANAIAGPWSMVQLPPTEVAALLPDSTNRVQIGGGEVIPRILIRTKPAELLMTSGLPDFRAIRGTALQYAADTDRPLFFHTIERQAYLLISGRWFRAPSLNGPWAYVAPSDLPPDFAKIPPGSPQAIVLASVPNTPQADLALLANSVPTTATVKRHETKLEVSYDGEPQFKPVKGTSMTYAVNADNPVIHCTNGNYYAIENGVWFNATSATGVWEVATEVPEEIYTIPTDSPVYYVTFASIYNATEDEVEVGYTPGYLGEYENDGTVVYGTGWDYDCWCDDVYYGWGWWWGYSYVYVPWYQWWVWRDWWDDPGGLRRAVIENIYDRWQNRTGVTPHDPPATTERVQALAGLGNYPALYGRFKGSKRPAPLRPPANTLVLNPYARPKQVVRAGEIPHGAQLLTTLRQAPGAGRDLYASPDGNVYRRQGSGWYRREANGKWDFVSPTQGTVQRERVASVGTGAWGAGGVQHTTIASAAARERSGNVVPDGGRELLNSDIQALEREYYARSLAQLRAQNYRSSGSFNRPVRRAVPRR